MYIISALYSASSPDLYVYPVCVQDNNHSRQLGVKGDCYLAVSAKKELLCALLSSRQVVGVWPLGTLRRYWCEDGVLGFEAGRHSPRGEGEYLFSTNQDAEIYDVLKQLTAQGDVKELSARPPAPLPPTKPVVPAGSTRRSEDREEDDKKYDVVAQSPPSLPPKPLLKGQSEASLLSTRPVPIAAKPAPIDTSLDISPAYALATPSIPNVSASVVTNVLYGPTGAPPQPNAQGTPIATLKRRYLHESITPKVEPAEPSMDVPLHVGMANVSRWVQSSTQALAGIPHQVSSPVDGTYAHTVHKMPVEFEVAEGPSTTLGPTLYNTMVHKGVPPHPHNEGLSPSVRDQQRLYDIAFTQSGSNSRPSSRNDYSVAYLLQDQVDGTSAKEEGATLVTNPAALDGTLKCSPSSMPPVLPRTLKRSPSPAPPVLPPDGKQAQDDSLTANPLYGSQNTVAKQVMSLKITTTPELHKRLAEEQAGKSCDPNSVGGAASCDPNSVGGVLSAEPSGPHLETKAAQGGNFSPLVSKKGTGDDIQRDSKGYSKVAKESKTNTNEAQDNLAPPPLPERHYE